MARGRATPSCGISGPAPGLPHFPVGKHDDMVDALGLVGQLLSMMQPGSRPAKKPPQRDLAYRPFVSTTEMDLYARGGDDLWTEHLLSELGDDNFSWKTL